MCVLWMPMPQKIANASTKFSSFFVNVCVRERENERAISNRVSGVLPKKFAEWMMGWMEPNELQASFALTKLSNLLINWITPMIWPDEFLMAIHSIVRCLKFEPSSTLWSNRWSSYALAMFTVYRSYERGKKARKRKWLNFWCWMLKTLNCWMFFS